MDKPKPSTLSPELLAALEAAMAKDPAGSKAKAEKARAVVMGKFATSMGVVKSHLPA